MSKLRLRIDKYLDMEGQAAPSALANIYSLEPSTSGKASQVDSRQEPIPISHLDSQARTVDVPPGRYRVQVALPSGEILTDDVRATDEKVADVVLKGKASPHEWLGWQFLVGNVASGNAWANPRLTGVLSKAIRAPGAKLARRGALPVKKKAAGRKLAKKSTVREGAVQMAGVSSRGFGMDAPMLAEALVTAVQAERIDNPIFWLSSPWPELLAEDWLQLGARSLQAPPVEELNSGKPPKILMPVVSDPMRAVFRVMHGTGGSRSATGLNSTLPRDFVVVRDGARLELLCLPTPWIVPGSGREALIEIVVQRVPRAYEFISSMTVHDEQLAMLLGFLSVGSLSNASALAEQATGLLFGKVENPLAAAAGAYALVGAETDSSPKPWHQWVKNLMNGNPKLPDGAIQYATLQMRGGPSKSTEACTLFKQACRRGLPYYSLGLRWLLDGLERFAPRDAEAAALAEQVRSVSIHMHQQSPFTILRLGSR